MRIERIELDGFGRFSGAGWDLGPGLTVVLGANEAGKTTLLNGIRALLFGFEATRDGRTWYPAFAGGRRGGRLALVTSAGERWAVERHGDRGGTGALTVRAPNGNTGGQETLDRLLAGVDKELFTNVFAFGLGELQSIQSLSGEGVRSRIYGAGSGLGGMSAADLERTLRARQEAVFRPRGRDQELNRLVARMEELRQRIAELEQQPARYEELHRELAELAADRQQVEVARRAAAESAARAMRLTDAQPPAAALRALEAELAAGDRALDALPAGLDGELTAALSAHEAAAAALGATERGLAALDARLAELRVDDALLAAAAEVTALADERPLQLARDGALAELRATRASAAEELADLARRGGDSATWLLALDDSIAAIQATRDAESRLVAAEARRTRAATLAASLAPSDHDPLEEALLLDPGVVADRRAALRELDELWIRGAAAGPGPPRRWLVAGVAAVASVVVGAILVASQVASAIPLALLAGLLAGLVAWRLPQARPTDTRGSERLLERAGLPPGADIAAIRRADDALAVAQASDGRRAASVARAAQHEEAERERAEAELEHAHARSAWDVWVAERRLPRGASPEAARQVIGLVTAARRADQARSAAEDRLQAAEVASAAFADRLERLLGRLGRPIPAPELRAATVVGLADALVTARAAADRCADLRQQLDAAARDQAPLAEHAAARAADLGLLLATHGAADAAELQARVAAAGERGTLHVRARELRARLTGIAGGEARVVDLLAAAADADPAALDVERDEATRRVAELDARGHELSTRAGELQAELSTLEQGVELGERRQELAVAEGRAAELARAWAVRAVALRLLEETRHRYERERQPRVVQDATAYFERITGGAYGRIVAAPGEASVRVEPASGAPRVTDELSRGTAEQLYLALRFGLVEQFARTAEPLPVVMDDILVNFDAERAGRAASAIRSLAERHQVLYFTCHPWTAALLDPGGSGTVALD
ncbi:MAG: AAA family ATPase [Chloroflexota bacterium]